MSTRMRTVPKTHRESGRGAVNRSNRELSDTRHGRVKTVMLCSGEYPARRPINGKNGLIVSFGEVMPMRLGRLQRQSRRAFWASAGPEVFTSELAGWCWARQTLMEKRALSRWQRESMIRAGPHRFTGRRPRRPRKGDHPIAG